MTSPFLLLPSNKKIVFIWLFSVNFRLGTHCCTEQGYVPNHPYTIWHHSHFRELETPRLFDEDDGGRDDAYKHWLQFFYCISLVHDISFFYFYESRFSNRVQTKKVNKKCS